MIGYGNKKSEDAAKTQTKPMEQIIQPVAASDRVG
jgi:hypothetical protein